MYTINKIKTLFGVRHIRAILLLLKCQIATSRQVGKAGGSLKAAVRKNVLNDKEFARQIKKIWDGVE